MTGILRGHIFPQRSASDEETREDAKGSISAGSRAGAVAIDNGHDATG